MADVARFFASSRGVSPVFAYALTLGIGTILVAGLVIAATGYVDSQRELTAQSELQVFGQQVSADLAAADRLSRIPAEGETEITRDLPTRAVGSQYSIHLRNDGAGPTNPYLELTMQEPDVEVQVGVAIESDVTEATVSGGTIIISADDGQLVMRNG